MGEEALSLHWYEWQQGPSAALEDRWVTQAIVLVDARELAHYSDSAGEQIRPPVRGQPDPELAVATCTQIQEVKH